MRGVVDSYLPHRRAAHAAVLMAVIIIGCERASETTPETTRETPLTQRDADDRAAADAVRYEFPAAIERQLPPAVAALVHRALEALVLGDYDAYRELISRNRAPASSERFDIVRAGIRFIAVESAEAVDLPQLGEGYNIIGRFDFDPETEAAKRIRDRRIAVLVFEEGDEWRIMVAPPGLQPREPATDPNDASPATQAAEIEYPWDRRGDY